MVCCKGETEGMVKELHLRSDEGLLAPTGYQVCTENVEANRCTVDPRLSDPRLSGMGNHYILGVH